MGNFFKNNDFKTDYKKRPNDEYKAAMDKLDDATKQKMNRQRTWILVAVVAAVFVGIIILAVTGIGTNKAESAGNILDGSRTPRIACLGDSVTEGLTITASGEEICSMTYPEALKEELKEALKIETDVKNYGDREGLAENTSYKKMSEAADIVILQYTFENYKAGEDPEGVLEANIEGLVNQGCLLYLVNYPYSASAGEKASAMEANQYIAKAAKDKSVLLLDAKAGFDGLLSQGYTEEDLYSADGIHLTQTGYEELGRFIAGGLISDAGLN